MTSPKATNKEKVHKHCVVCGTLPDAPTLQVTKEGRSFSVARCPNCGLVYSDIDLHPDSVLDEDLPYAYAEAQYTGRKTSLRYLNAIHKFKKPGSLLEIGCGMGHFLITAREFGWRVTGIDISPAAIRAAQTEFALENTQAVTIDQADFSNRRFDVITIWNTLEHMADPIASLEHTIKWLKPDGLVALQVPDHNGLIYSINLVLHKLTNGRLGISRHVYGSAEGLHVHLFTRKSLEYMFARWGFQACYLEQANSPARELLSWHGFSKSPLEAIASYMILYSLYALANLTRRQHQLLMVFSRG